MSRLFLLVDESAKADIASIHDWYEEQQPGLGTRFVEKLDQTFDAMLRSPKSNAEVLPDIRRAVMSVFPYLVFYAVEDLAVVVLAVIHAAQDPNYIKSRVDA